MNKTTRVPAAGERQTSRRTVTQSMESPLRIGELSAMLGIGLSTIYRNIEKGYRFEFPKIKRTTAKHFLEWCSRDSEPTESTDPRVEAEIAATKAAASTPSQKPRGDRRQKAAGKPHGRR